MMRNQLFQKAPNYTIDLVKSPIYLCEVRLSPKYFTREGKMNFVSLITFILNLSKKSLQLELDAFFKDVKKIEKDTITKQAFSEARQKISPRAFQILFEEIVKLFYTATDLKTYKGYRLSAIDGSTLELQNTEELRETFGYAENSTSKVARARISGLYDLENEIMIDAIIGHYDLDEREFALEHIKKLQSYGLQKDLIIFDRGYPSKNMIAALAEAGVDYLMRVSTSFLKEVNNVKGQEEVVEFSYKAKKYKLRVVKVMLETGEEEILITSVVDDTLNYSDFKELYFKRWGIETKYNEFKSKLQLENFTGEKAIAIQQDFYAAMYLTNMVAFAKIHTDEKILVRNKGKNLKYEYRTNTNILIGKLKDRLVIMMLEPNEKRRVKLFKEIVREIGRNSVPVRPGRKFERIQKKTPDRYPMNQKQCL